MSQEYSDRLENAASAGASPEDARRIAGSCGKMPEDPKCPACGSTEVSHRHALPSTMLPETDWEQCDDCNFQWGHQ